MNYYAINNARDASPVRSIRKLRSLPQTPSTDAAFESESLENRASTGRIGRALDYVGMGVEWNWQEAMSCALFALGMLLAGADGDTIGWQISGGIVGAGLMVLAICAWWSVDQKRRKSETQKNNH